MQQLTKRIGTGNPAIVQSRREHSWAGMEAHFARETISRPTDWTIREERNVLIVHLKGRMKLLETELDGRLGSVGPATPGELWSVPAGSNYASFAHGDDIEFAVLYLPSEITSSFTDFQMAPLFGVRDDHLHAMVRKLNQVTTASDDIAIMQAETLADEISQHVSSAWNHQPVQQNPKPRPLDSFQSRRIREYVWDNLSEQITIGQLAELVNLSSHDLLASFREVFQTSPAQYLISQRLRRAQWLLLYSKWDITRIALECGFSSHSHLTSTFKNRFGYPPSRYKNRFSKNVEV